MLTPDQITALGFSGLGLLTAIFRFLDQRAANKRAEAATGRVLDLSDKIENQAKETKVALDIAQAGVFQEIASQKKATGEALVAANNFHATSERTAQLAKDTNAIAVTSVGDLLRHIENNGREVASIRATVEELRRLLQIRLSSPPSDKPVV